MIWKTKGRKCKIHIECLRTHLWNEQIPLKKSKNRYGKSYKLKKKKLNSIMIIFSNKAISLDKIMSFEELMNNVTVDAIS